MGHARRRRRRRRRRVARPSALVLAVLVLADLDERTRPVGLAVTAALAVLVPVARWMAAPRVVARTRVRARRRRRPGTVAPARRPAVPAAIKRAVRQRDRYRCRRCGMTERAHLARYGQRLHLDHVIPWSHGGPSTTGNLRLLCQPCNLAKGARLDAA